VIRYYTPRDMVLATAFRAIEMDEAIGFKGVESSYPGLIQKEVGEYFDTAVHNDYHTRFPQFFEEHETLMTTASSSSSFPSSLA